MITELYITLSKIIFCGLIEKQITFVQYTGIFKSYTTFYGTDSQKRENYIFLNLLDLFN